MTPRRNLRVADLVTARGEGVLTALGLGSCVAIVLWDPTTKAGGMAHVLPTGRTARFSSPLGVYDFQKRSSVLDISAAAARTLGPVAATLADGEGLAAHAQSARYRLRND